MAQERVWYVQPVGDAVQQGAFLVAELAIGIGDPEPAVSLLNGYSMPKRFIFL